MKNALRVVYLQIGGLLLFAGGVILAQRVFPIADWIALVQQRVMHLGPMSAICYPLLYAFCNVLLLPGGILSVGGGFFFGLWWGFLIVWIGNVAGAALSFFLSRFAGRRWLGQRLLNHPAYQGTRTSRKTPRLENYSVESIESIVSDKLVKLSVWPNDDPVWAMPAVDRGRSGTGSVFIRIPWDAGSTRAEPVSRKNSPASHRICHLGTWTTHVNFAGDGLGPDRLSYPRSTDLWEGPGQLTRVGTRNC